MHMCKNTGEAREQLPGFSALESAILEQMWATGEAVELFFAHVLRQVLTAAIALSSNTARLGPPSRLRDCSSGCASLPGRPRIFVGSRRPHYHCISYGICCGQSPATLPLCILSYNCCGQSPATLASTGFGVHQDNEEFDFISHTVVRKSPKL